MYKKIISSFFVMCLLTLFLATETQMQQPILDSIAAQPVVTDSENSHSDDWESCCETEEDLSEMLADMIKEQVKLEITEEMELTEHLAHFGLVREIVRNVGVSKDRLQIYLNQSNIPKTTIERLVVDVASYYYGSEVTWAEVFDPKSMQLSVARFYSPQIIYIYDDQSNEVFFQDLAK